MHLVSSWDGTSIACQVTGKGPPLVLVHGTGGAAVRWTPILPPLGKHFTVYAMDRRGRGKSGDNSDYALEREIEDLEAVVSSFSEPVNLLGHSYGGVCAIETALISTNLHRLVAYEPPIPVPGLPLVPEGFIDRLQSLIEAGENEKATTAFMLDVVKMPAPDLERFKAQPAWAARVAAAHTLPREFRAMERYQFAPHRFIRFSIPTLLLLGGNSPQVFKSGIEIVAAALPGSRTTILQGQQHNAMDTAPDLFVRTIVEFFVNRN
jgi:pimeloyl-ACP methyl ester carboxylesterase